jgi:HEAT repeat protein
MDNINSLRERLQKQLVSMYWDSAALKGIEKNREKVGKNRNKLLDDRLKIATAVHKQKAEFHKNAARADFQKFMVKQWQKWTEQQAKHSQMIHDLCWDLAQEGPEVVAEKLKDEDPFIRWLAVQVVGKKRYHRESDLIDLLEDPHVHVRQAANQALVRLSRGNDFGPPGIATADQWAASRQAWRSWLNLQDPPAQGQEPRN